MIKCRTNLVGIGRQGGNQLDPKRRRGRFELRSGRNRRRVG
jgi:hypothetical protein